MDATLRALARRRRFASPQEEAAHLSACVRVGTVSTDLLDLAALAGHAPAALARGREPAPPDPEAFDHALAAQPRVVWVRAAAALARAVRAEARPWSPAPSAPPEDQAHERECHARELEAFELVLGALEARPIDRAEVFRRARPLEGADGGRDSACAVAWDAARLTLEETALFVDDAFGGEAEHVLGDEARVRGALGRALVDLALEGDLPVIVDGVEVEDRGGQCVVCEAELEDRSDPCPECGHAYGERPYPEPTEEEQREDHAWERRRQFMHGTCAPSSRAGVPPGPSANTALLAIFGLPVALMAFVGLLIALGAIR